MTLGAGRRASSSGELRELADIQRLAADSSRYPGGRVSIGETSTRAVSQPGDVLVNHVLRTGRARLAPEAVDQALDGHHLADVEQQDGEDRPLPPSAERNDTLVERDLERTQDPEHGLHRAPRISRRHDSRYLGSDRPANTGVEVSAGQSPRRADARVVMMGIPSRGSARPRLRSW